jgi:hypothetical protein
MPLPALEAIESPLELTDNASNLFYGSATFSVRLAPMVASRYICRRAVLYCVCVDTGAEPLLLNDGSDWCQELVLRMALHLVLKDARRR